MPIEVFLTLDATQLNNLSIIAEWLSVSLVTNSHLAASVNHSATRFFLTLQLAEKVLTNTARCLCRKSMQVFGR